VLDCPPDAAWFDDLPGSEKYWKKPVKKTDQVVSVNELSDFPQARRVKKDRTQLPALETV